VVANLPCSGVELGVVRMKRKLASVIAAVLVFSAAPVGPASAKTSSGSNAVVSVIDTGINPYHLTFRDDSARARKHPSTYIPGFPKDAVALRLSLNEKDYPAAVKRDCKRVWSKVETGKLYWVPGTKIVGAISFEEQDNVDCSNLDLEQTFGFSGRILDRNGHGTMTASRAASIEYGGCPDCLLVAVQGFNNDAVAWAADHAGWIDAQSNSWGPFVPAWTPTAALALLWNDPEFVETVESAARKHLSFWASGNGALTRGGVLGHPTTIDPRMTPSVVMVGGHDSGYVTTWHDAPPHVVSDICNCWAAYRNKIEESDDTVGSGTSSATPFAAGGAARILLEARRILRDNDTGVNKGIVAKGPKALVADGPLADGNFTLEEWKRLVFETATPRPEGQREDGPPCGPVEGLLIYSATPVKWTDVPDDFPEYLSIGYGAVDGPGIKLAKAVLAGQKKAPDRSATDEFFAAEGQVRQALHEVWTGP
jgi:hypothetical protein